MGILAPWQWWLNQVLMQRADRAELLAPLQGRCLRFQLQPAALAIMLRVCDEQLLLDWADDAPCDLSLSGLPGAYLTLLRTRSAPPGLQVEGEVRLLRALLRVARVLGQALESLPLQWFGPVWAGSLQPVLTAWREESRDWRRSRRDDMAEWLTAEAAWLPARPEWQAHGARVDALRRRLECLQMRLSELEGTRA